MSKEDITDTNVAGEKCGTKEFVLKNYFILTSFLVKTHAATDPSIEHDKRTLPSFDHAMSITDWSKTSWNEKMPLVLKMRFWEVVCNHINLF